MRLHNLVTLVPLILSTNLACGSSSEAPRRDGSTADDGPGQETYAQPDAPIAFDGEPDIAHIADASVTADSAVAVDGAVIDGAVIDGGKSALVVPSDKMEILLGFGCFDPRSVTVTNASGETLPPIRVSLEGPSAISFTSSGCTDEILHAGQTCGLRFALAAFDGQPGPGQADLVIQAGPSQARITLTWRGAMVGDDFFVADFGPVLVGSGPVLKSFTYVPNPLLQQEYASSIVLSPRIGSTSASAFSIVPNPDDCTQGPPRGQSCILQIAFQPPAPQAYEADVVGRAGCVVANGWLRGKGILPYDGGVLDSGGQDLGPGLDATTTDRALD